MMLRVRPAQFTTTGVSGERSTACARPTNSTPGASRPPGMLITWNSSNGRLSRITISSPASSRCFSAAASICGVSWACSTTSPNALLGTLKPLNTT